MPEHELTAEQNFQQTIKERLREDIGRFMPDEVLSGLVENAVNKLFFTERTIDEGWGRSRTEHAWFVEEVEKLLRERILDLLETHIEERKGAIESQIREQIAESWPELAANVVMCLLRANAQALNVDLEQKLIQRFRDCGLIRS